MTTSTYAAAGVRSADEMPSFGRALDVLRGTFAFPRRGRPIIEFGYYASVLDIGGGVGIAFSTDGVGTKLLVAQELSKYDTVGIDCVAMNANDVVCVGAEPLSMVDYIAVESVRGNQLAELAVGLAEGARQARISIPGGETAQVPEMLHSAANGEAFDLVGTCVGVVPTDKVVIGTHLMPGDVVVGFAASGIHSNGLTLARRVFQTEAGWSLNKYVPEFGRTLGEELLEPSRIYVDLALSLLANLDVKALAHITSDGLLNLRRVNAGVGFDIEYVPPPPPVFTLLQGLGRLPADEMYRVYNMGVGFCVVVPPTDVDRALQIGAEQGLEAWVLGHATRSPEKRVRVLPLGIEGTSAHFAPCP
jgi:phosphoribosylformylglycinamidine cyclo-ligase